MSDVTANGRTIVHKGDGLVNVAALPDVCKTPTPAGPTPVPYVNTARSSDLADGAKTVTIAGSPVAHEGSKLSQSSGDEPGTLGGVVSSKNRGKMTWGSSSPDVLVEGKAVVRFLDICNHNGNTHNTIHTEGGEIVVIKYGDDCDRCKACATDLPDDNHAVLPDNAGSVKSAAQQLIDDLTALEEGESCMVAVVQCGVCNQKFAAHSGSRVTKFDDACNQQSGLQTRSSTGDVRTQVEKRAKTVNLDLARMAKNDQSSALKDYWKSFNKELGGGGNRGAGICAGPRALALAMAGGHVPNALCEQLYQTSSSSSPTSQENIYVVERDGVTTRATRSGTFSHGHRVPSCSVCAELIPAMLCNWQGSCRSTG